jgi:hypothetical protein
VTDASYAHIAIIADRSGSMAEIADPPHSKAELTTTGIHEFVTKQKAVPGKTTFSLVDFDITHDRLEHFGDGKATQAWSCRPRGGTALLDAVGFVIAQTGDELAAMTEDDRPGRVIVVIATDGEENSSHEYKLDTIRDMVTEQREKYGWDFVFIGADIDAFAGSSAMGMSAMSTLPTAGLAMAAAYTATSDAVMNARLFQHPVGYNLAQREAVAKAARKDDDESEA